MPTHFVNLDLILEARFDLAPLVTGLESKKLVLVTSIKANRSKSVAMLRTSRVRPSVKRIVERFLMAIESLQGREKEDWDRCSKRTFNFAYDFGPDSPRYEAELSNDHLRRIAALGATISTVIYYDPPFAYPDSLIIERAAVEQEIRDAFKNVTREGTISWGETPEIDKKDRQEVIAMGVHWPHWEWDKRKEKPPFQDRDQAWEDLVDDPEWDTDPKFGGFEYLDPIGKRYYLPALIRRSLKNPEDFGAGSILTLRLERAREEQVDKIRNHFIEKWSALSDRQKQAVKWFLEYQIALGEALAAYDLRDLKGEEFADLVKEVTLNHHQIFPWKQAYDSYWKDL